MNVGSIYPATEIFRPATPVAQPKTYLETLYSRRVFRRSCLVFAMKVLGQDQRQTPVAAEKQRRVTHLHAVPIAGDGLGSMRLFSKRQLAASRSRSRAPRRGWVVR
jgi:hypothetical protein